MGRVSFRMRTLLGTVALGVMAAAAAWGQSYVDPQAGFTYFNNNGVNGEVVVFQPGPESVGTVKLKFWAFQDPSQAGWYFYGYQVINVDAGSTVKGYATSNVYYLAIAEIDPLSSHIVLGDGGGKGTSLVYTPWLYSGDNVTVASWSGTSKTSVRPGDTSPDPVDNAAIFEFASKYAPTRDNIVATASGGGYTGQALRVMAPVPEPGALFALATGLSALGALARRRRA
jgi:hypothetical protein